MLEVSKTQKVFRVFINIYEDYDEIYQQNNEGSFHPKTSSYLNLRSY